MTKSITTRQMVFILYLILTSITVVTIPKVMAETAGVGNWITLMTTALIFGILVIFIIRLNMAFPGKALCDYSRELAGKAGWIIIAVFYALYFLMVDTYLCYAMAGLLKSAFLYRTPHWAFLAAGMPVFGYVAYKGVINVARLFEIYGVVVIIPQVIVHTAMVLQGDVVNILPLVVPSEIGQVFGAIPKGLIAFLGIEILTVLPFSPKYRKAPKIAFLTILGVGLVYVLVVESSIMMVGFHEIQYYEYPLLAGIRQVHLEQIEFLRRMDVLYLTIGLMGVFAVKSMVYMAIVEFVSRLLPRASRLAIVIAVGAVIFGFGIVAQGIDDFDDIVTVAITYTGLIAAGLIPIILWVIAKVKKYA